MTENENTEVVNETENYRLVLARDGHEGELIYERRGDQLIVVHTEVPAELSEKGVGGLLVGAAARWAERDGLVIVPWCPYAGVAPKARGCRFQGSHRLGHCPRIHPRPSPGVRMATFHFE